MYGILYMIDKKYPNIKGGFIHIPYIPAKLWIRNLIYHLMSLNDIAKGLEFVLRLVL